MSNSEPFEQEVERMNTDIVRKKRAQVIDIIFKNVHYCRQLLKEYNPSFESELLSIRECLVRKAAVISKLDEELLHGIEDENEIAVEIDAAEEFQNFVRKRGVEIEQFFTRMKDEENINRIQKSNEDIVAERELLKRIASIFDPAGILSPAVVPLKILFQKMYKECSSRDDDINDGCKALSKNSC